MNSPGTEKPVIAVLSAPGSGMPPGLEPIQGEAEFRYAHDGTTLAEAIADADVLLVTDFRSNAVESAWPRARRLRWVHAASAGVDPLMFPALIESDVTVTNAKGIFDRGIAEYVLGLILAFAKDFPGTLELQRARRWSHRDTEGIEGRTVLIAGAGSIGREIGRLLKAAGMEVAGLARRARTNDPDFGEVHASSDLLDLLPGFDFVVVATPLTPETRHMFGAEAFRRMRPTARLINIGRGPVMDTEALIAALEESEIAGAALDVFEDEPLPPEHPLWNLASVIVSPHMAGDLAGWREALSAQFIDNYQRWCTGRPLLNVVDKARGYAPPGNPG